jgi:hypothetical protein
VLEASSDDEEASNADKPLFEVIRECTPNESPLRYFLNRPRRTSSLISDGGPSLSHKISPQDVWNVFDGATPARDYILMLHDIDSVWCEALLTRYPDTVYRTFLVEHILGLDLQVHVSYESPRSAYRTLTEPEPVSQPSCLCSILRSIPGVGGVPSSNDRLPFVDILLEDFSGFTSLLREKTGGLRDVPKQPHGFHVNCWRASQSGIEKRPSNDASTHQEFRKTDKGWTKSNAFVSCCRVASNICKLYHENQYVALYTSSA